MITGNSAYGGGGVYCDYLSSPSIINSTITGNSAYGGGLYCLYASVTVSNTIIAFNSSGIYYSGDQISLRYSCVHGNTNYDYSGLSDPTGTNGNISADPRFAATFYGNTHIQPDSPCVDAGDDGVVQGGGGDIDGQSRIIGTHVDIGADESDGTTWSQEPSATVRVSPDGSDANNGSTWNTAKKTVQAAIDATSSMGGDVWVRAGTYPEQLILPPYVHVYGGFDGGETRREQRDWRIHASILDGQGKGPVVTTTQPGHLLNTIDGFTVRNGKATRGAGIYCSYAGPTIANNNITGNAGSGVYCVCCSPVITGNTIARNTDSGIYCTRFFPNIATNTIIGNAGRGIYCKYSDPTIANNTIVANAMNGIQCIQCSPAILNNIVADNGDAGVYCLNRSSPEIVGNTITGNSALKGGGIYCTIYSSPRITNTIIAFNSSGVYNDTGTPSLRSSCVYGNTSYNYSGLPDPTGTNGNISADPRLVKMPYGISHIQPDSPCVDVGDDEIVKDDWRDVDSQPRIAGLHADIGADESDGRRWPQEPTVILRVSPYGNDANDGTSWTSAKRTVQAAIDTVAPRGGEVWVKAGIYLERVTLPSYVRLYGGFGGIETECHQRDWRIYASILDGQAGGAVVTTSLFGSASSTVDGLTIRNGKATQGGGIYCSWSSLTIANNTITKNSAGYGGGIFCLSALPLIANNTVTGNSATRGGGFCFSSSSPTIANNMIAGNAGHLGGAIYCEWSAPNITNNTISGNTASDGGGIYASSSSSSFIIANTIIAFNSSGVYCSNATPSLGFGCVYGNTIYNFSGLTDPTSTEGNLSADPSFVRTPTAGADGQWATADDDPGDLRLKAGSPCIDAGDNSAVPAGILTDLDGFLRFADDPATADTGLGTAPIVEMGAYEYIPGDFDRDGDIDADDMKAFGACVSGPAVPYSGDCAGADFDRDGDVDQSDFGFLQRWFGGAGPVSRDQ